MGINTQLKDLFTLGETLSTLLDNEDYENFQVLQDSFSEQIRSLLDNNPPEILGTVIQQLRELESLVEQLQNRSETYCEQLKEKSLAQQRNKNKIKAYK